MTPDQLKKTRVKAGMTQPEAATRTGVTTRTWQRWEAGKSRIQPAAAALLLSIAQSRNHS